MTNSFPAIKQRIRVRPPHSLVNSQSTFANVPNLIIPLVQPQLTSTIFFAGTDNAAFSYINSTISSSPNNSTLPITTRNSPSLRRGTNEEFIIGARDYNPSKWSVSEQLWQKLERIAVLDKDELDDDDIHYSVIFMDKDTINSDIPYCPVNGVCSTHTVTCTYHMHTHTLSHSLILTMQL